jgi:hypothetical protein
MRPGVAALLALLAAPSPAVAQADAPDAGGEEDPNLDRGLFLPTAAIQPAGSVAISNYELIAFGVSVAVTERLQVSATIFAVLPYDAGRLYLGHLKWQALSSGAWRLALLGGAGYQHETIHDDTGGPDAGESLFLSPLGGVVSRCLGEGCHSVVSLGAHLFLRKGGGSLERTAVVAASLIGRLSPHVKVLAELVAGGDLEDPDALDGGVPAIGLRFHGRRVAVDLGVAGASAFPFVSGTARF